MYFHKYRLRQSETRIVCAINKIHIDISVFEFCLHFSTSFTISQQLISSTNATIEDFVLKCFGFEVMIERRLQKGTNYQSLFLYANRRVRPLSKYTFWKLLFGSSLQSPNIWRSHFERAMCWISQRRLIF